MYILECQPQIGKIQIGQNKLENVNDVANVKLSQSDEPRLVIGSYLVSYKGGITNAGYIYQPYIPLYITPIVNLAGWKDPPLRLIIGKRTI